MITTKKASKLKKSKSRKTNQTYEKLYISGKELARRWGVSYRTIQRWRFSKVELPYLKIGDRVVRYSLKSIKAYEREYGPHLIIDINWGLEWQERC